MAIGIMTRLRATAAAIAASRNARAAELERERTDPHYFSQTGGVSIKFFRATWPSATLSGDTYLLRLLCPVGVFSRNRLFVFPRSHIQRLSAYRTLLSIGLRIEHTEEWSPEFIVFWSPDFAYLKSKLAHLGYDVED